MPYTKALEFAHASVMCFEKFGDYQGTWIAKVYYQGKHGWVTGYYGSCSGCDAFEGEFGYTYHICSEYGEAYNPIDSMNFSYKCERCKELKDRFYAFGKEYLDNILTKEQMLEKAKTHSDWDDEVQKMIEFIEKG